MKYKLVLACLAAIATAPPPAMAQEDAAKIPNFIGEGGLSGREGVSSIRALRFVTTLDFPPFSYLDGSGRLTGFNVYMAKSICAELAIQTSCTIQAVPFDELIPTIVAGRADAIISGLASTTQMREQLSFSNSYLRFPGRFVATKTSKVGANFDGPIAGAKIGVVAGSGHEKLARSYFPQSTVIGIANQELLVQELNAGKLDLMFGDGLNLSFWVNGEASKGCCTFVGEAYYSSIHLGEGMRIAALTSRPDVIDAVNGALSSIQQKRGIEELFLRFFPNSFF
ncbi:MAG: transporter substrate-binding domain-containing protein [Rhizobiaceae bacterium]